MMANTAVEILNCEACGADVREGSLFCYNCGSSVTPTGVVEALKENPVIADVPAQERPPLKSAASIRKHRRALNRQPVQVSWEAPEGPATAFIVVTIVLTVGAIVLLALALYLR
jgi:predicted amidophosphoribosyltransferase